MKLFNGHQALPILVTMTLVVTTLFSCSMRRSGTMVRNIPKEVNGWAADPEVRQYDRKTLFKYIDGGAELYLAYRFQKVSVYRYTKTKAPDIVMDMYDMGTPQDAFGVFTAELEGEDIRIGQGSEYDAGLLRFFKGRFFVSIMTHEETQESKEAVYSLARAVADEIQTTGDKPELLSSLPNRGLIARSIRYFHDHNILNLNYYLADENILLLDSSTEAVLARYSSDEEKPYLLLIKYPGTRHAKRAFESFLNAYMPDAMGRGIVQTEDGKWAATALHSTLVTVVLDAPSERSARALLEEVRLKLEVKP
ncbi:MAG: hypothetical protein GTN74_17125 [Proteobacteria bacterium]|nr:hypothetical protein [Pseudomonadota bacterium]NIS72462.1 hypothetical protein [Pseudomonadota bacterium]